MDDRGLWVAGDSERGILLFDENKGEELLFVSGRPANILGLIVARDDVYAAEIFQRSVVRECHRLAYRRIGIALSASASTRVQFRWLAAYLVQQWELRDLTPVRPLIARRWTEKTVAHWLDETRPEVVIASSPIVLLRWLVSLGYSVPRDIGVAGLSCTEFDGPISGSYERAELLGARAADVLIGLIECGKYGISNHLNTLLVDGIWSPEQTVWLHLIASAGTAPIRGLRDS